VIVDAFLFDSELDMLELRLNVLGDVVDQFVLVEATETFRGNPKPLYFSENCERFAAFIHRINYVAVRDLPATDNPWHREHFQRNAIMRGLHGCEPDDVILVSDVDEIPNPETIKHLPFLLADFERVAYEQALYSMTLNWRHTRPWFGTRAIRYADLDLPQSLRNTLSVMKGEWCFQDGGWSYSSFGGVASLRNKLKSFSHAECDTPAITNEAHLAECIRTGQDPSGNPDNVYVYEPFGEQHPAYLVANIDKYDHWLADREIIERVAT
jgi:beta-1,4-mannosyl-glycoprotein beta-1,4-N-acetylglucosaminyltransferase